MERLKPLQIVLGINSIEEDFYYLINGSHFSGSYIKTAIFIIYTKHLIKPFSQVVNKV